MASPGTWRGYRDNATGFPFGLSLRHMGESIASRVQAPLTRRHGRPPVGASGSWGRYNDKDARNPSPHFPSIPAFAPPMAGVDRHRHHLADRSAALPRP